ncbi:MAG: AAA family ATPase [Acidobacteriota bacterium]|nr:AAA family ATPase [Acidobacteriota bacterium]
MSQATSPQSPSGAPPEPSSEARATAPLTPAEIARALGRRVIGQEEAVREMAVALAKHLAGVHTGNILLIGSSGTGKTTLMRSVEAFLAEDPRRAARSTVVRFHAKVLAEATEGGQAGEVVLRQLLERAREQLGPEASTEALLERVSGGIVFVDEVDKIRSHVGNELHAAGIRAQEALLTLIENESVPFHLPSWACGDETAGGREVRVDSSGILFVAGGAFEGLYDSVYDRVTIGRDKGALQAVTVVEDGKLREELQFHLRDWLTYDDLFDYGMSPQFLSRFDAVVLLQDLGVEELMQIFLDGSDSSLEHAQHYFASQGLELAISPAAVRRIAQEAAARPRLGARALKEAFRRVIRDYEFDPAKVAARGTVLMIDEPEVQRTLARADED